MGNSVIMPLFYLPPVAYFSIWKDATDVLLEFHEHFPKQTFRNRAQIGSPNGRLDLIVPVVKGSKVHTPVKDVRIANEERWQRLHWMSIQTCYRSSAYFEFYEDQLQPFYDKKYEFLVDLNFDILELLLRLLKLPASAGRTSAYEKTYESRQDWREGLHPKKAAPFEAKPYFQVFEDRNGFLPNLSVLDLLCSQGPQAIHKL